MKRFITVYGVTPKYGTDVAYVNPHTLPGSEVYNVDLADFTNLLEDYHHLTENQLMNFSGLIYSDRIQKFEKSTDMVVKSMEPNAEGK